MYLPKVFVVIQLKSIEKHSLKEGEISNYKRRTISLPSRPFHLSVNCDNTKLVVVVEKYGCVTAILYEVASFLQQVGIIYFALIYITSVSFVESSYLC